MSLCNQLDNIGTVFRAVFAGRSRRERERGGGGGGGVGGGGGGWEREREREGKGGREGTSFSFHWNIMKPLLAYTGTLAAKTVVCTD